MKLFHKVMQKLQIRLRLLLLRRPRRTWTTSFECIPHLVSLIPDVRLDIAESDPKDVDEELHDGIVGTLVNDEGRGLRMFHCIFVVAWFDEEAQQARQRRRVAIRLLTQQLVQRYILLMVSPLTEVTDCDAVPVTMQ
jgi:hypothetical protein